MEQLSNPETLFCRTSNNAFVHEMKLFLSEKHEVVYVEYDVVERDGEQLAILSMGFLKSARGLSPNRKFKVFQNLLGNSTS